MGARGTLVLFRDLQEQPAPPPTERIIGRSPNLIAKRNEMLTDRYHYYLNFNVEIHGAPGGKLNYYSILEILQNEFCIDSEHTIPRVLRDCYERLHELKAKRPDKNYFKRKWPHLVW